MKNFRILFALITIVGLSLSCTTDSDSGSGSGSDNSQRVVSKIIFEDVEYDYADEYAFKYDSYGRITRVTHTEIEGSYDEICHYEYYRYGSGNGLEISWEEEDYVDAYDATLNNKGYLSEVYYEDGDYTDEWSYTYDSKGRLTRIYNVYGEYEESWSEATYSWSAGNIVEVRYEYEDGYEDYSETIETQLSYNSKSMDIVNLDLNAAIGGWFEGLYIDVCDELYWGDGLCGQKSKNFLTGWVVDDGEYEWEYSLKWSYDEDGYPEEVIVKSDNLEGGYYRVSIIYKS